MALIITNNIVMVFLYRLLKETQEYFIIKIVSLICLASVDFCHFQVICLYFLAIVLGNLFGKTFFINNSEFYIYIDKVYLCHCEIFQFLYIALLSI